MKFFDALFNRPKLPDLLFKDVAVTPGLMIPQILSGYWPVLEQAKKTSIHIHAAPAQTLSLQVSKFFHIPCIPGDFPYPTSSDGKFMIPLAQINFKECPLVAPFPASGYLQFYVADDNLHGIDFEDQQTQRGFRVLYFKEEELADPQHDFSFLQNTLKTVAGPVFTPHKLTFELKHEYFGMDDYQGDLVLDAIIADACRAYPRAEDKLMDILYERFQVSGHKLGGYASFAQEDPRGNDPKWRDHVLLFQMDSDDQIMWGDAGVANFFIHPRDLANADFSKVIYNWDCN